MNVSAETIALVKQALAAGKPEFAKSIMVATGLTYFDLQAPSKNLYPVITPLRNSIPRKQKALAGDATHWKVVSAILGSGFNAMGWVPEGQRSGRMSYTTAPKSAAYVTIGEEDQISFEAEAAGQGFEDLNATLTMRLLQKTMQKEEIGILAGNASMSLGTPAQPALSAPAVTGATLPTVNPYSVIVVALTQEGFKNSSVVGGVATSSVITGADGQNFTLSGGSSNKSANATQAITLGQGLACSVTPVNGAVGYAWFIGAAGAESLQQITTLNSYVQSVPLVVRQLASAITADNSKNAALAFDGILTNAFLPGSGAYINTLGTGTLGAGSTLTASGRGSVVEIDNMLQNMWDVSRISPTVIYVNSQQQRDITSKVMANTTGPLLRYDVPAATGPGGKTQPYGITANGVVRYYFNPYSVDGGTEIPIKVHPDLAAGTILGWAETLPMWYQSNEVPNVVEMLTRRDYYRIDWPLRTRQREYGVYAEEVLAVYAPFALGVINNIGAG